MFKEMANKIQAGVGINLTEAMYLAGLDFEKFEGEVLSLTTLVRQREFGDEIRKCSDGFLMNVCSSGCKYCYLNPENSKRFPGNEVPRVLTSSEEFIEDAKQKKALGVTCYKIVGTEEALAERHFEIAIEAFKEIAKLGMITCASMGFLETQKLEKLVEVGVIHFNHSLETVPWRFAELCTTNFTWWGKHRENQLAGEVGLKRCSGLIAGMGETMEERVMMAFFLRDLGVESMPFNIFTPPDPSQSPQITPEEALKSLAIFRLVLPKTHIIVNNGNAYFEKLFSKVFEAGASGFGVKGGSYLSHARIEQGIEQVKKLGLK